MPLVGGWPGSAGQIFRGSHASDFVQGFGGLKVKVPTPSTPLRAGSPTKNAGRVGHRGQRRRTGMSDPHGQSAGVASAIW
jgi:hypothetical protein